MRRIDKNKSKMLSVEYKKWLSELNDRKEEHPRHSRSYYVDVVMNLLHCQKGVCAYTEMFLCNPGLLSEDKWANGRYKLENPRHFGELEHFDPKLKKIKYWEWDNLFVIKSRINRLKGNKEVDDILKPDSPEYDPMKLLEYEIEIHVFRPHSRIKDKTQKERIQRMIEVLQLNHDTVRHERKTYLTKVFEFREVNRQIEIDRFFTACQMAAAVRKGGPERK